MTDYMFTTSTIQRQHKPYVLYCIVIKQGLHELFIITLKYGTFAISISITWIKMKNYFIMAMPGVAVLMHFLSRKPVGIGLRAYRPRPKGKGIPNAQ